MRCKEKIQERNSSDEGEPDVGALFTQSPFFFINLLFLS